MPAFENIVGQRFGLLVVVELHERRRVSWLCKCDCGNETVVTTNHLRTSHTQSCGHLKKLAGDNLRNRPVKDQLARFETKYVVEPSSGCWLWTGAIVPFGYGKMSRGRRGGGLEPAHRVAWRLFNGPIPFGMSVLHRCDVPACVNPNHLFLGTQADNIHDAMAKGRHSKPPIGLRGSRC